MTEMYCDPSKRHDFAFLVDVTNGNPNGDPDAGNLPRVDPETMHGLITDVCIKRKVRDWVDMTRGEEEHHRIYIQNKGIALNDFHKRAHQAIFGAGDLATMAVTAQEGKSAKGKKGSESFKENTAESQASRQQARRAWLCEQFYDVRTFGAVMSTGDYPSGQVRGPIQITFAQSIDPIIPLDLSITRVAVAKIEEDKKTTSTMGRKTLVPYGLYLGYGFIIPHFAKQTGFSSQDLELFWAAFRSMWDTDRSASRGMMALQGLYIFSHANVLGNAPAHRLFERIHVKRSANVQVPRHMSDYTVQIDDTDLPDGVTLTRLG
jgi:CRISPR-associated protein Csd2